MQTVSSGSAAIASSTLDPLALAGVVCARICHDLASSVGALTGTLELAAEEGDREALDLSITLAREVAARLRLLRTAWGADADVPRLATLLPGLPGAERLRLDTSALRAEAPESLRLCLSLLLVAAAGLPRGGDMRLSGADDRLSLAIEGARAAWPAPLAACLASEAALVSACESPRSVAVALACLQARALRRVMTLDSSTLLVVTTVHAPR
jgi:histidine phosphotransferase ChpT